MAARINKGQRIGQGGRVPSRPRVGTGRKDVSGQWGKPARPAHPSLQPLHFFASPHMHLRLQPRAPATKRVHVLSSAMSRHPHPLTVGTICRARRSSFGSPVADRCGWNIVKCPVTPDQLPRDGYSLLARSIPANASAKQMPQKCGPPVRLYPP